MKETGLMFKAPLVRAILSGQKTQTRRIFKTKNGGVWPNPNDKPGMAQILRSPPCGQPGDRIYVRETWAHGIHAMAAARDEDGPFVYAADGAQAEQGRLGDRWKPSIHMPKHAARIWLEVTGVRVERLKSISEADCWREGIEEVMHDFDDASQCEMAKHLGCCIDDAKPLFAQLWESTGARWDDNPWVWVIDFKTISTTGRPA